MLRQSMVLNSPGAETQVDSGYVFDIKKYSIHDGPGIRTTVFLKGCPLVCAWCHNPESQSPEPEILIRGDRCLLCGRCVEACPEQAISLKDSGSWTDPARCIRCGKCSEACPADAREMVGRKMTVSEFMETVRRDRLFYEESGGGVTFSGGEPLAQGGFLLRLLEECGKEEIHRVVDTSGMADWDLLSAVAERTDLFLYDLKLMDPGAHRLHTGADNEIILENLRGLSERGSQVMVRVPVIPGVNDDDANLEAIAAFLLSLPVVPPVRLLAFHRLTESKHRMFQIPYRLEPGLELPKENLESIRRRLIGYGLEVSTGDSNHESEDHSAKRRKL